MEIHLLWRGRITHRNRIHEIESVADYADGPGDTRIGTSGLTSLIFEVRGDGAAIASFSPGIALFHELIHAILGYQDPLDPDVRLGQCERHLNRMRVELGLAEREYYYPQKRSAVSPESAAQIYQGSLAFVRQDGSAKKRKEFVMTFNLDRIVDADRARSVQSIQADLLARRTGVARLRSPLTGSKNTRDRTIIIHRLRFRRFL